MEGKKSFLAEIQAGSLKNSAHEGEPSRAIISHYFFNLFLHPTDTSVLHVVADENSLA